MLVALAALLAAPAAIAARPVSAPPIATATLLQRMRAAADLPYQGFAESSGRLAFPDLGPFSDATALLSQTTSLRIWSASATHYRVDQLSTAGEHDYYRNGDSGFEWESGHRRALVVTRYPGVREPTAPQVTPPALGSQLLAEVPASRIERLGTSRVAGIAAEGLRVPSADARSLIDHVDVWLDPDTGLPLDVQVISRQTRPAAFSTRFLQLSYRAPGRSVLAFHPEQDPTASYGATVDGGSIDGVGNRRPLPRVLDGLRRRSVSHDGTATYGSRYALVAVIPIDAPLGYAVRQTLDSPSRPPVKLGFGEGSEVLTPLVSAIAFVKADDGFLVVGTLTRPALEQVATDLAAVAR